MTVRSLPRHADSRFSPLGLLRQWHMRRLLARERSRLADLDDHILDDIGLSREEARREAFRKDWDAPGHWFR